MKYTQEGLLGLGMIAVAQGVNTLSTDIIGGIAIVAVGVALLFVRGYLKVK